MSAFIDITGQRFGNLVAIERIPNLKRNATRFLCQCDCGNTVARLASSLKSGRAISCGCWRSLPQGEGAKRALYRYMECNSKYRNIMWNLDLNFFEWITKQPCHYCGTSPYQIYHPNRSNGEYVYNGIDRVNNDLGYIPDNCVPCCGYCNWMKSAAPVDKFKEWIIQVYGHWASK
jgi:hypothetical protein